MTQSPNHDAQWIRCAYSEIAVTLNHEVAKSFSRGRTVQLDAGLVALALELAAATLCTLVGRRAPEDRRSENLRELLARSEAAILAAFALVRLFSPPERDDDAVKKEIEIVVTQCSAREAPSTAGTPQNADAPETRRRSLLARLGFATHDDIATYLGAARAYGRRAEYNRACYYSSRFEKEHDKRLLDTALRCMTAAAEGRDAAFKKDAENDPMLRPLRRKRPAEWSRLFK